jgi:succinoglycan biosynthesis protein ExoV
MEVLYYRDGSGNFGDDLNAILWKEILPEEVLASDRVRILGIGSILTQEMLSSLPAGPSIIVMGTGTSYGLPPGSSNGLEVKAVRGPLTARAIGRPDASVTDGAILIAAAPKLLPQKRDRTKTVYIPHHKSLVLGHWEAAAKAANITFLDPRKSVSEVLETLSEAKLVLTEAMHGAIFADTLRIPWIPVSSSPRIEAFKWRDWTMSMELPYNPVIIPQSTPMEARDANKLGAIFKTNLETPILFDNASQIELIEYLKARNPANSNLHGHAQAGKPSLKKRARQAAVAGSRVLANLTHIAPVALALEKAAAGRSYLSSDAVFQARLSKMVQKIEELRQLA